MRLAFIFALVAGIALVSGTDDAQVDLVGMQGTWSVTAAERDGNKEPEANLKTMQVVIKGNVVTIIEKGNGPQPRQEKASLTLRPSTRPKSFDIQPGDKTDGQTGHERILHGISELDGSTLKMCWAMEGGEPPREFATKPNSKMAMLILKRDKGE